MSCGQNCSKHSPLLESNLVACELIAIKIYANELGLSRKKYITKSPILLENLLEHWRGGLRLAVKHNNTCGAQKAAELLTQRRRGLHTAGQLCVQLVLVS